MTGPPQGSQTWNPSGRNPGLCILTPGLRWCLYTTSGTIARVQRGSDNQCVCFSGSPGTRPPRRRAAAARGPACLRLSLLGGRPSGRVVSVAGWGPTHLLLCIHRLPQSFGRCVSSRWGFCRVLGGASGLRAVHSRAQTGEGLWAGASCPLPRRRAGEPRVWPLGWRPARGPVTGGGAELCLADCLPRPRVSRAGASSSEEGGLNEMQMSDAVPVRQEARFLLLLPRVG